MKKKFLTAITVFFAVIALAACAGDAKKVTGISIYSQRIVAGNNMYIVNGTFSQLEYKFMPEELNVKKPKLQWSSSDAATVKVDADGLIQGRQIGKAEIALKYKTFTSTVTVNVAAGFMLPDYTSASSTDPATVSDKAFDRNPDTFWKSNAADNISGGSEYIQAGYDRAREVKKVRIVFAASSYINLSQPFRILGCDDNGFEDYSVLASVNAGTLTAEGTTKVADITLDETAFYKNYRVELPRQSTANNFVIIAVEIYAPDALTK